MLEGHKHVQVHNSITIHRFKWKWSKPYTNFESCEGKFQKHLRNTLAYKAKQFMLTIIFSRKVYIS